MSTRLKRVLRRLTDEILLFAILALSAAAALAVTVDARVGRVQQQSAGHFQRLLGGLGLGCQADLARCGWQFDPRLMDDEDAPLDVVVGSHVSNPWHALSLFPAPSEPQDGLGIPARRDPD